jgi:hypothetical protein
VRRGKRDSARQRRDQQRRSSLNKINKRTERGAANEQDQETKINNQDQQAEIEYGGTQLHH